jgi:hypothetical protein
VFQTGMKWQCLIKHINSCKVIPLNLCIEHIFNFINLKNYISYDGDYYVNNKIYRSRGTCDSVNGTLKRQIRKLTKLKCYEVMTVLTVLYESETWVKRNKSARATKIQEAETEVLRNIYQITQY